MSTVASVDYIARRIYLSAATVGVPLDTMDVYRDVRALRRVTEPHRQFRPMIVQGGNIQKTPTTFTAPYVQLLYGCYIVPYDTPHSLKVIRDTFTDDGRAGVECFDRSTITANVDIDVVVDKVEVRTVNTAGASFTVQDIVSAIGTRIVDGAFTSDDLTRLMASVLLGKLTGAGTGTESFRDLADTKNRITATIDNSGNRTAITLDAA